MGIGSKLAQARKAANLTFYNDEDGGMPLVHQWCVIRDFDGGWAEVEVVVSR